MLNEHSKPNASQQKRKNKDDEFRLKKMISKKRRIESIDHPAIADDVVVVFHVLSRLPVKSLMRFKCVCKRWKSIIEQDPHFIHSHLTHSETRPGLFILIPKTTSWEGGVARDYDSFVSYDLHLSRGAANVHTIRKTKLSPYSHSNILGPVAGLICFVDNNCTVQIHNVSTMESTPWIKSKVCTNLENNNCVVNILDAPTCYFGFDPATKKHKAVFVWCRGRFRDFPVCEVLTVGEDKAWRIIYEVLPYNIYGNITQYANGSIYWLVECRWIMAFDVGSEKFRVIPAPEFRDSRFQIFSEVDGCLAVISPDTQIINMWILHDLNKENWTQETIKLPCNELKDWWVTYFHSVAGTDQMILETYRDLGECFGFRRNAKFAKFYLYDRKQKTFKKFEVGGVSFLTECSTTDCVSTFVESLLPVQKKMQ